MSFWKSLFGGGGAPVAAGPAATEDYNGFAISAEPYAAGSQFQVAGKITKDLGGMKKEHAFIRADTFGTREEAAKFTLLKARQIIDQQGDRMFQ
jgi:hypothetical protein